MLVQRLESGEYQPHQVPVTRFWPRCDVSAASTIVLHPRKSHMGLVIASLRCLQGAAKKLNKSLLR